LEKKYNIEFDKELPKFLYDSKLSIVFSTYQAGRLIIIGSLDGYKIHQIPVPYKRPMGIATEANRIAIASLDEISFFTANKKTVQTLKDNKNKYDQMYLYRASYNTSSLDIHDIAFDKSGVWGVNTLFSCLCKFTLNYNFSPKWHPYFITDLVPEDRCHLNGLAMKNGSPKYVTALSSTNNKKGWRKDIMNSGIIMDVKTNKIILDGLAMPHTPRLINNELYFLESALGRLVKWNPINKEKEIIYDFNRFVRGFIYYKELLIIGFSKIRKTSKSFEKVSEKIKKNSKNAGFVIFDLRTRTPFGELIYTDTIDEIYDVNIINGARKPAIITQLNEQHKNIIVTPNDVFWRKPKNK